MLLWKAHKQLHLFERHARMRKASELVTLTSEYDRPGDWFGLWNFSGFSANTRAIAKPGSFSRQSDPWFDNLCYATALGDLILKRVVSDKAKDFGVLLDSTNVEAHGCVIRQNSECCLSASSADAMYTMS